MSSEIEIQSLSLFKNKNESKRYYEAKELFDSTYVKKLLINLYI